MRLSNIKYLFYKSNRKQLAIVSTMIVNTALGAAHIVFSLVNASLFLGFSGAFNIIIAFGKFSALERLLRINDIDAKIKNGAEAKSIDKINNCTLIASFLFFSFGFVITFFYEDPANYEFWMIIYIALAAIIKIFAFIFCAAVTLRKKSGVKYFVKLMSGAAALISLALMQRALLYYLNIFNASILSGVGGIFFSVLAMLVAIFMVKKAAKQKKYLIENDLLDKKAKDEILKKQEKRKKFINTLKRIMFIKPKSDGKS